MGVIYHFFFRREFKELLPCKARRVGTSTANGRPVEMQNTRSRQMTHLAVPTSRHGMSKQHSRKTQTTKRISTRSNSLSSEDGAASTSHDLHISQPSKMQPDIEVWALPVVSWALIKAALSIWECIHTLSKFHDSYYGTILPELKHNYMYTHWQENIP